MTLPQIKVKVTADTVGAVDGLKQVGRESERVGQQAAGVTTKTGQMSGAFSKLSNVSALTRSRIQNTSFQLQDMAVQFEGGTKASRVFAQQLPQLLGGFGALGAAVGVLAGVGIPVLAYAFEGLTADSAGLDERFDDLTDAISDYTRAVDLSISSTADLTRKFGENAEAVRRSLSVLRERALVRAMDAVAFAVDGIELNKLKSLVDLSQSFAEDFGTASADYVLTLERIQNEYGLTLMQAERLIAGLDKLAAASGPEEISNAARDLNEFLLSAFGSVQNMPGPLQDIAASLAEADISAAEMSKSMLDAKDAAAVLADTDMVSGIDEAALAAARLAEKLGISVREALRLIELSNDPLSAFGGAGPFVPEDSPSWDDQGRSTAGKGRAGGDQMAKRLETLIESLKTERETLEEWRAENLELLATANEAELEALGGHNEARLRLEQEYQDRLADIKEGGAYEGLRTTLQAGEDILNAMGSSNDKALKAARAFGAGVALINAYVAASEVLKDPELPWFMRISAAATVLAAGVGFVSSIKSISSGSSGGASGAASGSTAATAAPVERRYAEFRFEGGNVLDPSALVDAMNDAYDQGYYLKGSIA